MSSRLARRMFFRALSTIRSSGVEIVEDGRSLYFGDQAASLQARIEVRDPRAYALALRGSAGLAAGYVDELWTSADPVAVVRIASRNLATFDRWRSRLHPVIGPLQRLAERVPRNTRGGAARNIAAHYDLGNTLFESFLDPTMMYSAAYYPKPQATLEQAQLAKLDRICRRLELGPGDHLIEIGTGWGGLAIHAAANYGCRVTTTTISREQHAFASARVEAAGLGDRIELRLDDYRDLEGRFDKLVSIEMIEAVGWQYFPDFFAKCSELVGHDGGMLLQAIVIDDDLYEVEKAAPSFANTEIFPGGCLPSEELIAELAGRNEMRTSWSDDISGHYARTLADWRERFNDSWPGLRPYGYDRRFQRRWNFYLAFSEAGFRERRIRDLQLLLTKPGWNERRMRSNSPTSAAVPATLSS
jgi:cyclopropane-fatty-acyl-phospholipid synthase